VNEQKSSYFLLLILRTTLWQQYRVCLDVMLLGLAVTVLCAATCFITCLQHCNNLPHFTTPSMKLIAHPNQMLKLTKREVVTPVPNMPSCRRGA
jgi:hypothetical protein